MGACDDHLNALDPFKDVEFPVPDALFAQEQSQHFDGGLGSILLDGWHVDIINEVDELLSWGRNQGNVPCLPLSLHF